MPTRRGTRPARGRPAARPATGRQYAEGYLVPRSGWFHRQAWLVGYRLPPLDRDAATAMPEVAALAAAFGQDVPRRQPALVDRRRYSARRGRHCGRPRSLLSAARVARRRLAAAPLRRPNRSAASTAGAGGPPVPGAQHRRRHARRRPVLLSGLIAPAIRHQSVTPPLAAAMIPCSIQLKVREAAAQQGDDVRVRRRRRICQQRSSLTACVAAAASPPQDISSG